MRLLVLFFCVIGVAVLTAKPVYFAFDAARLSTYEYTLTDDLKKTSESYKMYYYNEKSSMQWVLRTGIEREKVLKSIDFELTPIEKFDFKSIDLSIQSGANHEMFIVHQVAGGYTVAKVIELNFFSFENDVLNLLGPNIDFTHHKNMEQSINLSTDDSDSEVYYAAASQGKYFENLTFRLIDKNNMTRPKSLSVCVPIGILRQSLNGNSEIVLTKVNGRSLEAYEKEIYTKLSIKNDLSSSAGKLKSTNPTVVSKDNALSVDKNEQPGHVVFTEKSGTSNSVDPSRISGASAATMIKNDYGHTADALEMNNSQSLHMVQQGESLFAISRKYSTTVKQLSDWNRLDSDVPLKAGMTLIVGKNDFSQKEGKDLPNDKVAEKGGGVISKSPVWKAKGGVPHVVQPGETLVDIAETYGYTLARFRSFNELADDKILVGQKLLVTDCICSEDDEKVSNKQEKKVVAVNKANLRVSDVDSEVRVLSKPKTVQLTPKGSLNKKRYYTVKEDDTLPTIAKKNKISVEQLRKWNNLEEKDVLVPFQKLIIENN